MRINYLIIASALTGCKKETPAAPENNQLLVAPIQTGQGISTIPDTDGAKGSRVDNYLRLRQGAKLNTDEESEGGQRARSVIILPYGTWEEEAEKEVLEQENKEAPGSSNKQTAEAQVSAEKAEKSADKSKSDDPEVFETHKIIADTDNKNGSPINVDEGNTGNVEEGNTGS